MVFQSRSPKLKRIIDVLGAIVGILIFGPLMIYLAWRVRRELGTPVLFRQTRAGLHGKPLPSINFALCPRREI